MRAMISQDCFLIQKEKKEKKGFKVVHNSICMKKYASHDNQKSTCIFRVNRLWF